LWEGHNSWLFVENEIHLSQILDQVKIFAWWWFKSKKKNFQCDLNLWAILFVVLEF